MGFARKMRKSTSAVVRSTCIEEILMDPMFQKAVAFDEVAGELAEGEARICGIDGAELVFLRGVSYSEWHGDQEQLECLVCGAKYVQFVPHG